jgi:hypothetical protein
MLTIVVDSNQIVTKDWTIRGANWQRLRKWARTSHVRLVVPEVVIKEAVARHRAELVLVENSLRRLHVPFDVDVMSAEYESKLRSDLATSSALSPLEDVIDASQLVDRATSRIPPFNPAGNGFRDTILWFHVLQEAAFGGPVVLVSGDKKAFWEEPDGPAELRSALVEEAANVAEAGRVLLLATVEDVLREFENDEGDPSDPALEAATKAISEIIANDRGQVETNIAYSLEGSPAFVSGLDDASITIVSVSPPITIESVRAVRASSIDQLFIAVIEFSAQLIVDVELPTGEATAESRNGVELSAVPMSVEASFDAAERKLDGFSSNPVEVEWRTIEAAILAERRSVTPGQFLLSDSLGFLSADAKATILETMRTTRLADLPAYSPAAARREWLRGIEAPTIRDAHDHEVISSVVEEVFRVLREKNSERGQAADLTEDEDDGLDEEPNLRSKDDEEED